MYQDITTLREKMKNALDAYKADTTSAKPYFTSMKEISSWLTKKEN